MKEPLDEDEKRELKADLLFQHTKKKKKFVKESIQKLRNEGFSMAKIERALELPARTIERWKIGCISCAGVALLRIIVNFPEIIRIAENRFDLFKTPDIRLPSVTEIAQTIEKEESDEVARMEHPFMKKLVKFLRENHIDGFYVLLREEEPGGNWSLKLMMAPYSKVLIGEQASLIGDPAPFITPSKIADKHFLKKQAIKCWGFDVLTGVRYKILKLNCDHTMELIE